MKVLVCGSRHWTDYRCIDQFLNLIGHVDELAHGGARGADELAGQWARNHSVPETVFPADWRTQGRSAGPKRNNLMLRTFEPDIVVAFKERFDQTMRTGGTEHMVRIAVAAGVFAMVVPTFGECIYYDPEETCGHEA